jgi:hypothetical protein
MTNPTDQDPTIARRAILVQALGEPYGAEKPVADTLSNWLSTGELSTLVRWATRACDERTTRVRDLLARVVTALSDATRDEHGNYLVTIGPSLARHLLDQIRTDDTEGKHS